MNGGGTDHRSDHLDSSLTVEPGGPVGEDGYVLLNGVSEGNPFRLSRNPRGRLMLEIWQKLECDGWGYTIIDLSHYLNQTHPQSSHKIQPSATS